MKEKGRLDFMMLLRQYWNDGQPNRSYYFCIIVLNLLFLFVLKLSDAYVETVIRVTISNVLLLIYLIIIVKFTRGICSYKYILNTSLYMHVFFILSNWAENLGICSLLVLPFTHLYIFIIQVNMMKKLVCEVQKSQLIIGVEVFYIIYCFTGYVFSYVQDYILFTSKIMNFPLIA